MDRGVGGHFCKQKGRGKGMQPRETGEPPGARGRAFLANGDGREAAGTASGSWVLHARGATTTTQLSTVQQLTQQLK